MLSAMQHFVAPTMKFICEAFGMQATRMMNRFKSCEENSDFFFLAVGGKFMTFLSETKKKRKVRKETKAPKPI